MVGTLYKRLVKLLGSAFFLVGSTVANAEYTWNLPEPVTPMAKDTLHVHNIFMLVIILLFVVVLGIMIYSLIVHRKDKGFKASTFTMPSTKVQIFWTSIPFLILLYIDFVLMGIPAWHAVAMMEDTKTDAEMVVKITGSQWKWEYEYMDEGIRFVSSLTTPASQIDNSVAKGQHYLLEVDNPLVLPTGKKIRFLLTSADVIHEWWVPAFGVKRNSIPGFIRETWATIDKEGTYRGQCTELCGKGHGFMPVVVEAVSQEKYREWVASQKAKMQPAAVVGGAAKEQMPSQAGTAKIGGEAIAAAS